jgi:hypothetical protein
MRCAGIIILVLNLGVCAAVKHTPGPHPIAITTTARGGGEARLMGRLTIHKHCLVVGSGKDIATPIFDDGVTITPDENYVQFPRDGVHLAIGQPFRAAAAWRRDGGRGWSIREIKSFFGIVIPPGCPTDNVVRLRQIRADPIR